MAYLIVFLLFWLPINILPLVGVIYNVVQLYRRSKAEKQLRQPSVTQDQACVDEQQRLAAGIERSMMGFTFFMIVWVAAITFTVRSFF